MPAISSGVFGFPKEECAEIMIRYTFAWFKRGDCGTVTTVRLCNSDIETTGFFIQEAHTIFGDDRFSITPYKEQQKLDNCIIF